MQQKYELRIANANAIAMLQYASFDWHVVDKGAVQTLQIHDHKLIILFLDLGMAARNGGVRETERGRSLATNGFDGDRWRC